MLFFALARHDHRIRPVEFHVFGKNCLTPQKGFACSVNFLDGLPVSKT